MSKRPFPPRQGKRKPLTLGKREPKEDVKTGRQPYTMGYKTLEDSLRKSNEELLYILLDCDRGFMQLIEQKDIRKDLASLVLKAATRAALCTFHKQGAFEFLGKFITSNFFSNVPTFLNLLPLNEGNNLSRQSREDILNIIELTKTVFERLPSHGVEMLSITTNLKQMIEIFLKGGVDLFELLEKFNDLEIICSDFKAKMTVKIKKDKQFTFSSKYVVLDEPPDDYKSLPTIPTKEELVTEEKPFLRPGVIEGAYPNNLQYLDIQFRLLREDFISPLRAGIQQFLGKETSSKRIMDIRIYENVKVLNKLKDNFDKITFALKFNSEDFKRIRWESSKRLMYGSLLCLSHDEFKTVIFATVENKEIKDLKKGFLYVHLINPNIPEIFEHTFIAVESSVYYEAYYHILESLKEFSIESLPFENYIVKCDVKEKVNPPEYLKLITHYDIEHYKIPVLDTDKWPTCEQLHLDESQYFALQLALTKKFAIIQGPPGCGKTFIGLKIVELILSNKTDIMGPILVVCYTNHALDQFLEGILNFGNRNIVRIGGRSSSEILEEFNLNNRRKTFKSTYNFARARFQISKDLSNEYLKYSVHIKRISEYVETISKNIISENELYNAKVLDYDEYCKLRDGILLWLTQLSIGAESESEEFPDDTATFTDDEFVDCSSELSLEDYIILDDSENPMVDNEMDGLENSDSQNSEASDDETLVDENILLNIDEERFLEESVRLIDINECEVAENTENLELSTGVENYGKIIWVETDKMKRNKKNKNSETWILNVNSKKLLKGVLIKLQSEAYLTEEEAFGIKSKGLWKLSLKERRQLYLYWLTKYRAYLRDQLSEIELKYKENAKKRKEIRNTEDCEMLQKVDVIGMTTTGAAKNRELLKQICPRIVIIEEAAEILEAHIITTLSKSCEHVILIGDHKQLRPKPNSFELATKFNLSISLFERMIMNGMPHVRLCRQHRMRPEIASLMVHFYKDLENHESVLKYDNIDSINGNIFFIQHEYHETEDNELRSHSNLHEAKFIKALCRYLLLQKYQKEQITILTPYVGQMLLFRQLMPKDFYEGIRICCLDNYQGEENDIILLSLVRSNPNKKIGFLNSENRVCVALSRAKKGFYCIGNFEMLVEISEMWSGIINNLKACNMFGRNLALKCINHQTIAHVACDEDFINLVPEGGCSKPCEFRLTCGHVCEKPCHTYDVNHEEYNCLKPCNKTCSSGHPCQKLCFKECLPCSVIVEKIITTCGHSQSVPCFEKNNTKYQCQELCDHVLSCGHKCQKRCGKTDDQDLHLCSIFCKVPVKKYLNCGHFTKAACSEKVENFKCSHKVEKKLNCGHLISSLCSDDLYEIQCSHHCQTLLDCKHTCKGSCADCHQGRVHKPCGYDCKQILVCSHACTFPCTKICPPCRQKCENRCSHSRCSNVCGKECTPCKELCTWRCKHFKCTKLCYEFCNRLPCNKPCPKRLKCKHQCIGLCGEPCPSLCRFCHKAKVTEIFFGNEDDKHAKFIQLEDCKHIIEVTGLDQWMNLKSAENDSIAIQLKTCPKCKTPIRRNLRYGNIIKKALMDIEEVKCKILDEMQNLKEMRKRILNYSIECQEAYSIYSNNFRTLTQNHLESFVNNKSDLLNLCIIENQIKFTKAILDVEHNCNFLGKKKEDFKLIYSLECKPTWKLIAINPASEMYILSSIFPDKSGQNILGIFSRRIKQEVEWMKNWALKFDQSLAEQPIREFSLEVTRLQQLLRFYEHIIIGCEQDITPSDELKKLLQNIQIHINKPKWFPVDNEEMLKCMKELERLLPWTVRLIPEDERIMIVKAIGLKSGHWYKCPKGHPYAIGDCGGASEISVCPECKSKIGGTNHNLITGNALAPEMDGASYSAWSNEANMRDFQANID